MPAIFEAVFQRFPGRTFVNEGGEWWRICPLYGTLMSSYLQTENTMTTLRSSFGSASLTLSVRSRSGEVSLRLGTHMMKVMWRLNQRRSFDSV